MNILNWVVKLIPLMVSGITAVEGLFNKNEDKKTAVVTMTTGIVPILVSTGIITQAQADAAPQAVGDLNDAFVKFLKAFGILPSSNPATPATVK